MGVERGKGGGRERERDAERQRARERGRERERKRERDGLPGGRVKGEEKALLVCLFFGQPLVSDLMEPSLPKDFSSKITQGP